jgi:hypothetical protein
MGDYNTDILIWSERQAELLKRLAVNPAVSGNEIDWPNIIEEIEAVGRSELRAVESLLFQALVHMLKADAWPLSDAVLHWQGEARGFRAQARRAYTSSMAQRLDLAGLYRDALLALPEKLDGQDPLPLPAECPVTLDQMLAD